MWQIKHCWTILMCLLITGAVKAQVSFAFVPEIQGRTLDGLFMARTVALDGQSRVVKLSITVTEQKAGKIVEIQTPAFHLFPGSNAIPPQLARSSAILFENSKAAAVTRQSGSFIEGDYEYCYRLLDGTKTVGAEVIAEQCFQYYLQPFSPLMLLDPADESRNCNTRPTFFWQPVLPAVPNMQYRLLMVEIKEGQHKVEAINTNLPLINQLNINTPMLFYPAVNRPLEEGKRYAWQVTAYRGTTLLAESEIWEFTNSCVDKPVDTVKEAFRDIEDLAHGNFYVANGAILFALHNAYNPMPLIYSISGITEPTLKTGKPEKIRLDRGMNYITLDLQDKRAFKDGNYYQLSVKLPNGEWRKLRFLYKNPNK